MMKKFFVILAAGLLTVNLSAYAQNEDGMNTPNIEDNEPNNNEDVSTPALANFDHKVTMMTTVLGVNACSSAKSEPNSEQQANKEGKKVLVAYFSWSGNTRDAAQYIAQKTGADEFEIIREKPYPTEYTPCTEDAKAEKEANERPAIKGKVDNMAQYDVIFVGVPVWWYTAPMPVFTFLEQYDLKGKTVIPFCTCFTAEYETLTDIVKATPNSDHLEGLTIVTKEMGGKGMDKKHKEIDEWLSKIGF